MSDIDSSAHTWIVQFAELLGVQAPTDTEIETLLSLAGVAAHSSHRQAAPVACWLAATAGISPLEALTLARQAAQDGPPAT